MEKILVVGANGTTGKEIVNLLNQSQYFEPYAMVRKPEQEEQFKSKGIKIILADLEEDVSNTTKGMDKVIFAAGSGGKKVKEVDENGAKKIIDASKKDGIKKFVMLSSMGADQPEEADQLKDYLKAKHNADLYLKDSGLNYAIVRPGILNNNKLSNKIELSEKLNKRGEISRSDVAQVLARVANDDVANNETFEIIKGSTLIADAFKSVKA
ncbi:SDR family oxidoreductase [Aurantibacter aestuarii]|uniref:NAD-dependent dehydratase n=1 Tax=Aurantibacter aestuarii TaxID=1266046 RepID=A0A2T1NCN8_9FLAO|nr:SDR family oxidoreductase [Aurantibacter aestuarii]PSG90186.1 NAD-dependent dehydratase [Aurantibacter aestuarii]